MSPSPPRTPPGQTPEISIVVPVFNASAFLSSAVDSVLGQTFGGWELILVDDGSVDDSLAQCTTYAARDARIRVVAQANGGPSAARNRGVREARGTFVFFLDADDRLPADALAHLREAAAREGGDLILGNFLKQENDAPPKAQPVVFAVDAPPFTGETRILAGQALLDYVRHFLNHPSNHLVSYCWARLYRRAVILAHGIAADESMRLFEDFAFNLAFLCQTRKLVFVNHPVYVYTLRSQHASASMSILHADSLTRDMTAFRTMVGRFADALSLAGTPRQRLHQEAGHTLIHYAVIFIIRTCRQIAPDNHTKILGEVQRLVTAPVIREALPCYRPRPGTSRLIPFLMQLKFTRLLAVVARVKGNRRYGKIERKP
ncbi:glycosyltransferase family 2 protein [Pseudothauera nasutitermitis]|uniref:Glycosyltransferase family 2 protein n=1 Tax=Pseudothauera nasutitermitis TaxID=2565930 RepID=A0A4S4AZR8_9RHOO|nr:glycosyltransferase family 2 protein [Pseudothauera nasutitermitis]THF65690.1 glycosyltransferase family 2 protein [Pseudothauera nasutitermitis]